MHSEALKAYSSIINSKIYVSNCKLQVNMGNIYFAMGNYQKAVKLYKMALDKVNWLINAYDMVEYVRIISSCVVSESGSRDTS